MDIFNPSVRWRHAIPGPREDFFRLFDAGLQFAVGFLRSRHKADGSPSD